MDGKPVEGSPELYGTVTFYRDGGGGAPAVGVIKAAGRYTLSTGTQDSLELGTYQVAVSVRKILPPKTPDGLTSALQLSLPKYASPGNSGFKVEVKPGRNTFDFALQSK